MAIRFYVEFKLEAPLIPEGAGLDNSMTKTELLKEFTGIVEKYHLDILRGPTIVEPEMKVDDESGNRKILYGNIHATCKCTLDTFIEFYQKENGSVEENGRISAFSVTLNCKRGLFGLM